MKKRRLFIVRLFLLAMTTVCCSSPALEPEDRAGERREYRHANGLVIKLKKEFSAQETPRGFLVEPADESKREVRVPVEIRISLNKGAFPGDGFGIRKMIGNRQINYRIEKTDGGSGGEMYSFVGLEKVSGGYLEFARTLQTEASEPDFQTLWELIENTSVR